MDSMPCRRQDGCVASKLFHAVVGVGISLGSVAACGGAISHDEEPETVEPKAAPDAEPEVDAGNAEPRADAGSADSAASNDGSAEVPDAGEAVDAQAEASDATAATADATTEDAIVAAFCDVPWPITKSGREVCGPYEECAVKAAPWCFGPAPNGTCVLHPLECVDAEWQCLGNSSPTNGPAPPVPCQ